MKRPEPASPAPFSSLIQTRRKTQYELRPSSDGEAGGASRDPFTLPGEDRAAPGHTLLEELVFRVAPAPGPGAGGAGRERQRLQREWLMRERDKFVGAVRALGIGRLHLSCLFDHTLTQNTQVSTSLCTHVHLIKT